MWYLWSAAIFFVGYRLFAWSRAKGSADNYPAPDEPEILDEDTVAAWRKELHSIQRKMVLNAIIWLLPTTAGLFIMLCAGLGMLLPLITDFQVRFV